MYEQSLPRFRHRLLGKCDCESNVLSTAFIRQRTMHSNFSSKHVVQLIYQGKSTELEPAK